MVAKENIWKRAAEFGSLRFAFEHYGTRECSVETVPLENGGRTFENPSDGLAFIFHIKSLDFHFCLFPIPSKESKRNFVVRYFPKNEQLNYDSTQLNHKYGNYVTAALDSFQWTVPNLLWRHQ